MKSTRNSQNPSAAGGFNWLYVLLILCGIGLFILSMGFIFPGLQSSQAAALLFSTPTRTFIQFDSSGHASATLTPFQPLPTETPTPTATFTPLPTATATATFTATPPPPTPTSFPTNPPVDGMPSTAYIAGLVGYAQHHNLTCESRSAVDWADFFGISISEDEFQAHLPLSDNPEKGFVGSVDDPMGKIPPNSYGVHAAPVARVLRDYGLSAVDRKNYSFDDLRQEIANGDPVIVWIIGNVWSGYPVSYTAADGDVITVANWEHTAIVVGYDEYGVILVDNYFEYWRDTETFLNSWAVLGYMAITTD